MYILLWGKQWVFFVISSYFPNKNLFLLFIISLVKETLHWCMEESKQQNMNRKTFCHGYLQFFFTFSAKHKSVWIISLLTKTCFRHLYYQRVEPPSRILHLSCVIKNGKCTRELLYILEVCLNQGCISTFLA